MESEDSYSKSREKLKTRARAFFCYWTVRELGYGLTALVRQFGLTQPAFGYAVKRGEHIAKENHYRLLA